MYPFRSTLFNLCSVFCILLASADPQHETTLSTSALSHFTYSYNDSLKFILARNFTIVCHLSFTQISPFISQLAHCASLTSSLVHTIRVRNLSRTRVTDHFSSILRASPFALSLVTSLLLTQLILHSYHSQLTSLLSSLSLIPLVLATCLPRRIVFLVHPTMLTIAALTADKSLLRMAGELTRVGRRTTDTLFKGSFKGHFLVTCVFFSL